MAKKRPTHAAPSPDRPDLAPVAVRSGDVLEGRYDLVAELAQGGMGAVFVGQDRKLGRQVALKVLRSGNPSPVALQRFEQETRAAGSLNHPNVLTVFDVGEHCGKPYLVTELLRGKTLRQRLGDGPLAPAAAAGFAAQIARGLSAAHKAGIVHRDLKPDNIFVTDDGFAKILDFGIAKLSELEPAEAAQPLSAPGLAMGTVGYMAPEQLRGEPVDARADVFSFGAVLYEMISGERAFKAATDVETGHAVLSRESPPLPAAAGPELQQLVASCLQKDRALRPASAAELAETLQRLAALPSTPPGRWRRLPAAALGLAAALAALALVAFWLPRKQAPREAAPAGLLAAIPFDASQAGAFEYLGEGLVDLLHERLRSGPVQALDPHKLLPPHGAGHPVNAARGRAIAAQLGAQLFLIGKVTEVSGRAHVHAELYSATVAAPLRTAEVEAGPDAIPSLAGALVSALRLEGGPGAPAAPAAFARPVEASELSSSPEALRSYLEGETELRHKGFREAVVGFQRAVEADPGFALAHYRLAVVAADVEPGLSADSLQRALATSAALSPRHRRLLAAFAAVRDARPDDAERLYRDMLRERPDDAEAWNELGELLFHLGPPRGRPTALARPAFENALLHDPGDTVALSHLADLAVLDNEPALARTLSERYVAQTGTEGANLLAMRWVHAWAAADPAERDAVLRELREPKDRSTGRAVFTRAVWLGTDLSAIRTAAQAQADSQSLAVRSEGFAWLALLDLLAGRPAAARAGFARALELGAGGLLPFISHWIESLEHLPVSPERLAEARAALRNLNVVEFSDLPALRTQLDGLLALRQGDRAQAEKAAAELEAMPRIGTTSVVADLARGLRAHLLAHAGRKAEALALLEAMELHVSYRQYVTQPMLAQPLLRSDLLADAGRRDEALAVLRAISITSFLATPLIPAIHLRRGRLLEASDPARARAEYAALLELWRGCEPALQPVVEQVRERLGQLP